MVSEEVVQKKFRVTIPAELREKMCIREGDTVLVKLEGSRLVIEPKWLVDRPTETLGSLGAPKEMVTEPERLEEKIRRHRSRGLGR